MSYVIRNILWFSKHFEKLRSYQDNNVIPSLYGGGEIYLPTG